MKINNLANLETCTVTDIIDYFRDIIGDNVEDIIYSLYDQKASNLDKENIDNLIKGMNFTDERAIKNARSNIIYSIVKNSEENNNYNTKIKVLYEIYSRYHSVLIKSENKHKLKKIKDLMLEDRDAVILGYREEDGKSRYAIITREEPRDISSIRDPKTRKIVQFALKDIISLDDFNEILQNDSLASSLMRKCILDFLHDAGIKSDEVDKITGTPIFKDYMSVLGSNKIKQILTDDEIVLGGLRNYIAQYLMSNVQLLDLDTLMYNAATRVILGLKVYKGEKIKGITTKDDNLSKEEIENGMQNSIEFLKEIASLLAKRDRKHNYTIYREDGEAIISVDLQYIKDILSRCTTTKYFNDEDILKIHEQIKEGVLPEFPEERKVAGISIEDLINANSSYEEIVDDNEKKQRLLICNLELIEYLKGIGKIKSNQEIIDLYLEGKLSLDILKHVDMQELQEEDYITNLKSIYESILEDRETNEKKFIRYAEWFKILENNGNVERSNLIENMLETYGEEQGNTILLELYNLGIINLEECVEWAGIEILQQMFDMEKRNIQPSQINSMYHNNILTLNEIINLVLRIPSIEERYITIASIFPEVSESEERQELIYKTIQVDKALNKKGESRDESEETGTTGGYDYNRYITDSTYRFNLIRLFDKEYFMEMTADGHAVIKFPKFKKVMIEKMLDSKKEEGYGAATYILDEAYYLNNEDEIKVDNKINRRELIIALKEGKADRFSHIVEKETSKQKRNSAWGERLKRYFNGLAESKYTEEEEQAIDDAIANIKKCIRVVGVGRND